MAIYKIGYEGAAKMLSTLFFNVFFFTFSYIYGLQSMAFIFYFPFLVSYIYMYKDSANKVEAKFFVASCFVSLFTVFAICSMEGFQILSKDQVAIMFRRNFVVAFILSAYFFSEIFNYLVVQMRLAQEASESKARFLSVMSHELRTPLNGIISAINLMDTATRQDEKQQYSDVLKTSSQHLLNLVNNVLDFSKASSGKMQIDPVNCSLETLLLDLKTVFQPRFQEKDINLAVLIDEEVKRSVLLDDTRFAQVLSNLLSNALKFTATGEVVIAARCVTIKNATIEVQISVTDTGKGLTIGEQKRIFESFNNVYNKSRNLESSGLGLSICKMIVEMMGGQLLLESQPGKGSKFYFQVVLPLVNTTVNKAEINTGSSEWLEGAKIMIAEDNPVNRLLTVQFLKKWKVDTVEAEDGLIAQKRLLHDADIDVLLLDLQMPGMNGFELMEWIRESGLVFPVIAFTAQTLSAEEKMELLQLGFTDMIPKPFAPAELQQKLQVAVQKRIPLMQAV
ncbi:MAG: response regulator [Segetibacter sp.]|nr:response regulator [Segetibacter sp.]